MGRNLAKPFNLLHHSINTEYRNYDHIPKSHRANDREELRKIVITICKHIGQEISDRKAGVHIDRLGYFFVWKVPRKMTYHVKAKGEKIKERYNHHTGQHMYTLIYQPSIDKKGTLKLWLMDKCFNRSVKERVRDKILSGFRYKAYPYSILRFNRK